MNAVVANSYNVADQARMAAARNYFAWQARLVKREIGQRVIEIGCGAGNFTQELLDREAVLGIDIDEDCLRTWRARYADYPSVRAISGDAANLPFDESLRFRADSIVCLNVLEHIDDDRAALRGMASILPGGGRIVLMVPAFEFLYGAIDRNLGHHRRYTRASLMRLVHDQVSKITPAMTGGALRVRKLRYMNLPGFFGWWMNARVLKLEAQSESQIAFADRFIFPIASRLEAIIPPPFGQSIFCVLEKL